MNNNLLQCDLDYINEEQRAKKLGFKYFKIWFEHYKNYCEDNNIAFSDTSMKTYKNR